MPLDKLSPDHDNGTDEIPPKKALDALSRFPLLKAIFGRRSRRFGAGMEIPDGPFAYRSNRPVKPIESFERNLLVAIGAGVSGWNFGIPHASHGDPSHGCDYPLRNVGRTYPSGAAVYGSELLITDDSGSYITKLRDFEPTATSVDFSPKALVESIAPHIVRISGDRVALPAEYPHIGTHNHWVANKPGTTLFVPISDQAETLLNLIWIYTGEGSAILNDKLQPLGKASDLFDAGLLARERSLTLRTVEAVAFKHTMAEITIAAYNIQLGLQAIGLGGWLYTGINGPSLLGAYTENGLPGFGFRFSRKDPDTAIALGLDGHFEPLVPPYVSSAEDAVRTFLDRKFSKTGVFGQDRLSAYRNDGDIKSAIPPPSSRIVDYFISVVSDIYDQYGRFPVSIAPVGAGIYTQAQHIDTAFYDRFYKPGSYLKSHADHDNNWHRKK